MSNFKFVGGEGKKDNRIDPADVLQEMELGDKKIQLVKATYPNRQSGGVNYVVKLCGIGNPTTFGAEKAVALQHFMDAILEHFVSVGQLAPAGESEEG